MDDILEEFCNDSRKIIAELELILEKLEDSPEQYILLESYGQKIDRIMGAAKSLGYDKIGSLSESSKIISYKAAQTKNINFIKIAVAILFDAVDAINEILENLVEKKTEIIDITRENTVFSRVKFITDRLTHIQRASVAIDDQELLGLADSFANLKKK
jgi:chemotaxis protein histidine kinase CheA